MKQLLQSLSRVSNRSYYFLLRSDSSSPRVSTNKTRRSNSKVMKMGRSGQVPEGHLPVYVGEEMERFVVKAKLLNHPMFKELLNQSEREYGYQQQGVLRIPCRVSVFEQHLLRCLSRVSNRSHYFLLGSDSSSPRGHTKIHRSSSKLMKVGRSGQVPEGHLPVYVGEEKERFVVSFKLLNHPMFLELLNRSANEYGYEQQGVLRIPCNVSVFQQHLLRCLSRVCNRSHYFLLGSDSSSPRGPTKSHRSSSKLMKVGRSGQVLRRPPPSFREEKERFVVSAKLLNHPMFLELLNQSANEYGYEQQGVLRIPFRVSVFQQVLVSCLRPLWLLPSWLRFLLYTWINEQNTQIQPKLTKVGCSRKVPGGHLPVYVGEEMKRFVVKAKLLNHPMFKELLNQSANEYGYEQQGVLRFPCRVSVFEQVLEKLRH
ncbi:LOW QUALITY PROTEIN: auxin-responsive protein SAUR71-like protein [Cinnamomum micranthum f. kanehirae]|uniref:Auxin-responsive protein SAUR71-like protein n=1 Tax=Cinnamomum micranthum f. kanehirae TaxID=337451 RepID=A0A443NTR0_9MAGN|nr:LOW QUALITY PROTEIN: auxin-responsive protein SAUR71-like protein [Cinnamomum micranthum f. kanehirae]